MVDTEGMSTHGTGVNILVLSVQVLVVLLRVNILLGLEVGENTHATMPLSGMAVCALTLSIRVVLSWSLTLGMCRHSWCLHYPRECRDQGAHRIDRACCYTCD